MTLDEALASATAASGAEIVIDYQDKELELPEELGKVAVVGDHNTRRINFRILKKPDELDLSDPKVQVEVQYKNNDGGTGRQYCAVSTDSRDPDIITISFLIPRSLATSSGDRAEIQLCAHHQDGRHWHISPMKVSVGDFFECEDIATDDPKYDVILQLEEEIKAVKEVVTSDPAFGNVGFLTLAQADSIYLRRDETGPFLKLSDINNGAASGNGSGGFTAENFLTRADAAISYLGKADAAQKYLTKDDAYKLYEPKSGGGWSLPETSGQNAYMISPQEILIAWEVTDIGAESDLDLYGINQTIIHTIKMPMKDNGLHLIHIYCIGGTAFIECEGQAWSYASADLIEGVGMDAVRLGTGKVTIYWR